MLYQFLLYSKLNQSYVYICLLPLELPSHSALIRVPCAICTVHQVSIPLGHQIPISGGQFFHQSGSGLWFQDDSRALYSLYICLFISIIIISAPSQIIRHQIWEIWDPCYTVCSHQLSILYMYIVSIVYMCQSNPPVPPTTPFLLCYPYVCSLCLCLYFYFADRITCR